MEIFLDLSTHNFLDGGYGGEDREAGRELLLFPSYWYWVHGQAVIKSRSGEAYINFTKCYQELSVIFLSWNCIAHWHMNNFSKHLVQVLQQHGAGLICQVEARGSGVHHPQVWQIGGLDGQLMGKK